MDLISPKASEIDFLMVFQDFQEIGVVHQFQFSSNLQRMSVITKRANGDEYIVYCKGSPEKIISLSKPSTGKSKLLVSMTTTMVSLEWTSLSCCLAIFSEELYKAQKTIHYKFRLSYLAKFLTNSWEFRN